MILPEKYRGAKILDQSPNLFLIETPDGNSFWVRKHESEPVAASNPKPESGEPRRRYRGPGKKPKILGFRDKDRSIVYNAEGLERQHLHAGFAARPRSSF